MFEVGALIDEKYQVVRVIGLGGMGVVFEAEAIRIHRRVALKVMLNVGAADEARKRFELEAQAAGRIGSPHVVDVLDVGVLATGEPYLVMEYLEGESLRARMNERARLAAEELASVTGQLLAALEAAHSVGIVHRDLKPENVFLQRTRDGAGVFVKLLDFGISKFGSVESLTSVTKSGQLLGTPNYMAPEQADGSGLVDGRADVYALGVILYEAVCGELPFVAPTLQELILQILRGQPEPLARRCPTADPGFCAIVGRAMARDPEHRFPTVRAMHDALGGWLAASAERRVSSKPPAPNVTTPGSWTSSARPTELSSTNSGGGRSKAIRFVTGAAVVSAIGAAVWIGWARRGPGEAADHAPDAAAALPSREAVASPPGQGDSVPQPSASAASTLEVAPATSAAASARAEASPPKRARSPERTRRSPQANPTAPPGRKTTPAVPGPSNEVTHTRSGRPIRSDL